MLWWDDWFILVAMLVMSCYPAGTFLLARARTHRAVMVATYSLISPGYYIPVWFSRLSSLFTVLRVTPYQFPAQRRFLGYIAAFFVFQFVSLVGLTYFLCEVTNTNWKAESPDTCEQGKAMFVARLLAALVSDVILVAAPLWILRRVLVNPLLRFRVISIFSVSLVTAVVAIGHAVLVIAAHGVLEVVAGIVEGFVACTAANALVLIPAVFHRARHNEIFQDVADTCGPGATSGAAGTFVVADMTSTAILNDIALHRWPTENDKDKRQA